VCGLNVVYYSLARPTPASGQWLNAETGKGIDILLTNEWPSGILKNLPPESYPSGPNTGENAAEGFISWASIGSPILGQVLERLCPRYHFAAAAKGLFYERPPYVNLSGSITRFLAIAPYDNPEKQKFLYAASLTPVRDMDKEALSKRPTNTTISPFVILPIPNPHGLLGRPRSGSGEGDGLLPEPPLKRQRGAMFGRGGREERGRGRGQGQHRNRDERGFGADCWFCLKSPKVEKHLVVSIGEEVYVTLAKGELVPEHMLLIPVEHVASVTNAHESVRNELEKYKDSLKKYFKSKGKTIILFERFMNKSHHCHIQVVPISEEEAQKAKAAITAEAARRNITFDAVDVPAKNIGDVVDSDQSYMAIELPDGSVLLYVIGSQRVPMELGRELIAELIGKPERREWKGCVLSKQEEIQEVYAIKEAFHPYDWTS